MRTNSVTFITNHEAAFITVCAPENDCPVVVGVTSPTSLTDSAGIHPVTSTLTAGAADYLRVLKYRVIPLRSGKLSQQYLERSQYLPELACLVELFYGVSILQTKRLKSLTIQA